MIANIGREIVADLDTVTLLKGIFQGKFKGELKQGVSCKGASK